MSTEELHRALRDNDYATADKLVMEIGKNLKYWRFTNSMTNRLMSGLPKELKYANLQRFLLYQGAQVEKERLLIALKEGNVRFLKLYLAFTSEYHFASMEEDAADFETKLLARTYIDGDCTVLKLFLSYGYNIQKPDYWLHVAAEQERMAFVVDVVLQNCDMAEICDRRSIWEACIVTNNISMTKVLLDHKFFKMYQTVFVRQREGTRAVTVRRSPLALASRICSSEMVKLLLSHGADMLQEFDDNQTPLSLCQDLDSLFTMMSSPAALDVITSCAGGKVKRKRKRNKPNSRRRKRRRMSLEKGDRPL